MSYLREIRKNEKAKEKKEKERQKEHKCCGCPYGTWYGQTVYCPFIRCFRKQHISMS